MSAVPWPEKNSEQTELCFRKNCEHQQGKPGDNAGENQRQEHEAAEEGLSWKGGTIERQRCQQAQSERERDAAGGDDQTVCDGIPDGAVGK